MTILVRPSHHLLTLSCVALLALTTAYAVNSTLEAVLEHRPVAGDDTARGPRSRDDVLSTPLSRTALARQLGMPAPGSADPSPARTDATTGPMPNTLGLKLLGTLVSTAPSATFASIYDGPTRRTRSVWLGSDLGGAQVLAIERTRVIVLNAGRLESIDPGEGGPAPTPAPPASPQGPSSVRQVGPSTFEISRQQLDHTLGNLAELSTQARLVPAFTNGEARGFKLFSIRPGSLIAQLGLRNGDVLKRINGLALASPEQVLEAYGRLRDTARIELEVEREGQPVRQTYTID